jgi:tetratricopeptide (TPR) repeat protein
VATLFAYIALLGWIPGVIVLFALVPARKAAATALIGAWLLLPPFTLVISSLPDYSKNTAAAVGILLGTLIFGIDRLVRFRPRWFDLPMLLWCLCGIGSSLQNGLGLYDGLSDALTQTLTWGLPYLFGRLYFSDPEGMRYFATAMVVGGLLYVLPCLYEIRMSPQLLANIYGGGIWQGTRLGGFRPNVFFQTGLELGLWMTAASLAGWWLWRCGTIKSIGQMPFGGVLLPILIGTTIICRSTGALALLLMGTALLWMTVRFRTRLLLAGLLFAGPLYVAIRVTNLWSGQHAVDLANILVGPDRAVSLEYRFKCEDLLMAKALQQPTFGWGGWDRSAAYFGADTSWPKRVPTDGLWIIILGTKGYVGLILFYLALILPAALFVRRFPERLWGDPQVAACSLATVLLGLYMIDCLMNGFPNIIYVTLAGGLIGLEPRQLRAIAAGRGGASADRRTAGGTPRAAAIGAVAAGPIALADRYRSLGRSFKQEGRPDEALAAWRQALDTLTTLMDADPDAPGLRRLWCDCANDLAWLQANHPDPARRDPAAAVAMARRMVRECPEADTYWNTLGVAYYRAGDDDLAVAALGGGTAFDDVFLALAHARLGDLDEARLVLARASIRAEQDYPGHPELAGFLAEAQSVLAGSPGTPAAAR